MLDRDVHAFEQLETFVSRGILLDANLLVVYIVAIVDTQRIGHVKRTEVYGPDDGLFLLQAVSRFTTRFTTPGILTEATNLLEPFFKSLPSPLLERLRVALIEEISILKERHLFAKDLVRDEALFRYGFSDLAIASLAGTEMIVLSADLPLCLLLESRGLPVVNYNYVRPALR